MIVSHVLNQGKHCAWITTQVDSRSTNEAAIKGHIAYGSQKTHANRYRNIKGSRESSRCLERVLNSVLIVAPNNLQIDVAKGNGKNLTISVMKLL